MRRLIVWILLGRKKFMNDALAGSESAELDVWGKSVEHKERRLRSILERHFGL